MTANGVEFMRKVGIVSTAVATLIGLVLFAHRAATQPIMKAIQEETRARIVADSLARSDTREIALRLSDMSRDRFSIIEVLEYAPGSRERLQAIRMLRRQWASEESARLERRR